MQDLKMISKLKSLLFLPINSTSKPRLIQVDAIKWQQNVDADASEDDFHSSTRLHCCNIVDAHNVEPEMLKNLSIFPG